MESAGTRTMEMTRCRACSGLLLEDHRFCRWCGAGPRNPERVSAGVPAPGTSELPPAEGRSRPCRDEVQFGHSVSGPLLTALLAGVSAGSSARGDQGTSRRLVLALVWIPIWLIIVMLSPLDAYAAAKSLSREM